MPRPRRSDLYVAKLPFWAETKDGPTFVNVGERVRDGHELLRKHPDYFEPIDTVVHHDVEQATAAPGELR